MAEIKNGQSFPMKSFGFLVIADLFTISVGFFFIIQNEREFQYFLRGAIFGIGVIALPFFLGFAARGLACLFEATGSIALYHRVLELSCVMMGLVVLGFGVFGLLHELGRI